MPQTSVVVLTAFFKYVANVPLGIKYVKFLSWGGPNEQKGLKVKGGGGKKFLELKRLFKSSIIYVEKIR